jgi:hypothetical protein
MKSYNYSDGKVAFTVKLDCGRGLPCSPYYPESELDGFQIGQQVVVDYSLTNKRQEALNPGIFKSVITYLWVDCAGVKYCLVEGRYTPITLKNITVV